MMNRKKTFTSRLCLDPIRCFPIKKDYSKYYSKANEKILVSLPNIGYGYEEKIRKEGENLLNQFMLRRMLII